MMPDKQYIEVQAPPTGVPTCERREPAQEAGEGDGIPFGEGRYQLLVLTSTILAGISFLVHLMSFRIMTRVMDHWCRPPEAFSNLSVTDWRTLATPLQMDGSRSQCTRREPPDAGSRARIVPCEAWEFDLNRYGNNIISEWRLVCKRRWLVELAVMTYMTASAVSLPLAGLLADSVGRISVLNVSLAAFLVTGLSTSLADSYLLFVALRIVVSVTSNSFLLLLYAVLYEVTTPARRELYCFTAPAVASVVAPLLGLVMSRLRLGWEATHLLLMAPTLMMTAAFHTVREESPTWLMARRDLNKARDVALNAATMNGVLLDDCLAWFETHKPAMRVDELLDETPKPSIVPDSIRRRFALTNLIWASCSFAFNQVNLNDTVAVNRAVAAAGLAVMVPLYFAAHMCVRRFGAKRCGIATMLLFSVLCAVLVATFGAESAEVNGVLLVALRMLANLFVGLVFLITVQQFPVMNRCTGLCSGFALGRVTGSLGELLFRLDARFPKDIMIAFVGVVVALASVATAYLPGTKPANLRK
ncbi:solute carrier family 22 member 7-like [Haemaphysalis longicornis]